MPEQLSIQKIYQLFGVAEYAEQLQTEDKHLELKKLNEAVSSFILMKSLEELPDAAKQELATTELTDGTDLYNFFSKHLDNFQERLAAYGREFNSTIVTQ